MFCSLVTGTDERSWQAEKPSCSAGSSKLFDGSDADKLQVAMFDMEHTLYGSLTSSLYNYLLSYTYASIQDKVAGVQSGLI
jgi:hypothetical protein